MRLQNRRLKRNRSFQTHGQGMRDDFCAGRLNLNARIFKITPKLPFGPGAYVRLWRLIRS